MNTPDSPADISRSAFRSNWIKLYEFGFVVMGSAFVNVATQTPVKASKIMEWCECMLYLLAAVLVFQIYQHLTAKWTDVFSANSQSAITVYHEDKFNKGEVFGLRLRLGACIGAFVLAIIVKFFEVEV